MGKQPASILGVSLGVSSWPTALIGIVIIKAVLSLALKPGSFLLSYSGISYLVLLVLATCFAVRNGIQNTLGGRLFWAVLATAYGLWSAHQALNLYYELGLRIEVPANSIDDSLLFLHVGALVAAVATLPHRDVSDRQRNTTVANVLFVTLIKDTRSLTAHSESPIRCLTSYNADASLCRPISLCAAWRRHGSNLAWGKSHPSRRNHRAAGL